MNAGSTGAPIPGTVIDENASLHQFYACTATLRNRRHIRFLSKNDDAEIIEWHFKYRGRQLTLQYNIYNGISLFPLDSRDQPAVQKIAVELKNKATGLAKT